MIKKAVVRGSHLAVLCRVVVIAQICTTAAAAASRTSHRTIRRLLADAHASLEVKFGKRFESVGSLLLHPVVITLTPELGRRSRRLPAHVR